MTQAESIAALIRAMGDGAGEWDVVSVAQETAGLSIHLDADVPLPLYIAFGAGEGLLLLPRDASVADIAHELAHHLRGDGLASYLRATAYDRRTQLRLARVTRWREEAGANAVVALLYPPIPSDEDTE